MSRRANLDTAALNAALVQAVKDAREAQTALEDAQRAHQPSKFDLVKATAEGIRERLALLEALSEMGMAIVCALNERIRAAQAASGTGVPMALMVEAADVFCKLSRSIRLIIMLEMRAEEALEALLRGRPTARQAASPPPMPRSDTASSAKPAVETPEETETRVDPVIPAGAERPEVLAERETPEPARPRLEFCYDDIRAAARERLFLDRHYADFLTRPLDQLIPALCRDLGLTPTRLREAGQPAAPPQPPPSSPPSRPPPPAGGQTPAALAGPSSLVLDRAVALPPPRAP